MAHVTVVNDSREFLELMHDLISDLGHEMVGFKAEATSIDELVETEPNLLIVDLRLEDTPQLISGWELLVLARSHRKLVATPVILCTADAWELKKRAADLEQIAGVHIRVKPFDLNDMADLIRQLLDANPPSPAAP